MRPLALVIAAALLGAAAPAAGAPSISLNGVSIDGVTSQKFENCTVVIDEKGNVDIQAKGYAVKNAAEPHAAIDPQKAGSGGGFGSRPVATAPAKLTRRYFLATEQTPP